MYNVYVYFYYTYHTWHVFLSSFLLSELFTAVISNNSSVPVFLIPLTHKKELLQKHHKFFSPLALLCFDQ